MVFLDQSPGCSIEPKPIAIVMKLNDSLVFSAERRKEIRYPLQSPQFVIRRFGAVPKEFAWHLNH